VFGFFIMANMSLTQWAKSPKKQSVGQYSNMALYFECRINKTVLFHIVFCRFCPLGMYLGLFKHHSDC